MQPNPDYISDVESIYNLLNTKYDNVSLDDRDLSIGRKIKDSELIGIPWTLIIGNNFNEKGQIELISRSNSDKIFLSKQEIENFEFEQYTP